MIVCGVQTPNCIRATAFDGLSLDYNVIVPSDATASASQEVQDANLHGEAPQASASSCPAFTSVGVVYPDKSSSLAVMRFCESDECRGRGSHVFSITQLNGCRFTERGSSCDAN